MPLPAFFDAPGTPAMASAPPFFQLSPNAGVRPPNPEMAPVSPTAPSAPAPGGPGLFSRIGAGIRGPGVDPLVSEWLSPEQRNYLASQGQAGLASSLLQASGPAPQGTQNFASRLGGAMQGGLANWRQMQQEYLGRAIQSIQFGWEMQARQTLQQALEENPAGGADASPAEKAGRLARVAARMAMAGPIGAEYAKEYASLSKMILEDSPMSAKDQNDEWTKAIGPSERAAHAWEQYQPLIGKYDRTSIVQRARLMGQIMNPDKPEESLGAYENPSVWREIPGIGPILAAALEAGRITPEDAATLDKNMRGAASRSAEQADRILEHQRLIGESGALGRNWKGYYNPFHEIKQGSFAPTPSPTLHPGPGAPGYRWVMQGGKLVRVRR